MDATCTGYWLTSHVSKKKSALEKQISQLSLLVQQCMVGAWLLIKLNRLNVAFQSVFQYPVTKLHISTF